ncbi:hypothetical protein OESDEN_14343, partial [Oesophagostomum dentatum]
LCGHKVHTNLKSLNLQLWRNFANISNTCVAETILSKIKTTALQNKDDVKHYIFCKNVSAPSTIVSLGIGEDVTVELQLKNMLPAESEFFGADPVVQPNSKLFGKVGTFFPFAVGAKTGIVESTILQDDGSYKDKDAISIDFISFLKDMVNRTTIDLMIMDNEGPEFDLVPMIAIENALERNGITICQLNVEFHAPGPAQRYQMFERIMSRVFAAKLFVPLESLYWGHQRIYFVNLDSPYCMEKYITQFF